METVHTVDLDGVGAGSADVRAHGVEEVCQVHDVGLPGGVFNDGTALGQSGRKDDVHGCAHGHLVQVDPRAAEPAVSGVGVDKAVFHIYVRAKGGHALDMLLDGPHAEVAAAGHGGLGAAEAAKHCADEIIGSPDLAGQVKGYVLIMYVRTVDLDGGSIDKADLCAHMGQDGQKHVGVADLRDVFNAADAVDHKCCGDDGHGRVFRAADLHLTVEHCAAFDHVFFQVLHLPTMVGSLTCRPDL